MDDCRPIYGCPYAEHATQTFARVYVDGKPYVYRGRAYVPESVADLLAAYERTDKKRWNVEAEALMVEIARRKSNA